MNTHKQIGGEKINVSYAFAKRTKQQKSASSDSNQSPEKKPSTPPNNTNKTQAANTGLFGMMFFDFSFFCMFLGDKQASKNSIYVGQLPENVEKSDLKKLFSKSTEIELFPATTTPKGVRAAFAFVTFPDENSAAAAIKLGPSLKLKNTPLKVAYQSKRGP